MLTVPYALATPYLSSEIAPLREVIVHRPGLELDRLTPSNAPGLLFDDVLWGARAREEHDAFVELLRCRGGARCMTCPVRRDPLHGGQA